MSTSHKVCCTESIANKMLAYGQFNDVATGQHPRYTSCWTPMIIYVFRADSRFAPSKWEKSLQSNAVSHWLGASLESALCVTHNKKYQLLSCWIYFRKYKNIFEFAIIFQQWDCVGIWKPSSWDTKTWALSQYKDRLIYVWRFPC